MYSKYLLLSTLLVIGAETYAKNRYETFAQNIDGFDALAHGG